MTPDKARDLVESFEGRRLAAEYETYGLADSYQHTEHYVLLEIDGEHPETGEPDVWADTLGMPDKATADMIAAAPTLAAMVAGMRTEYRAEEWQGHCPGWVPTSPWMAEKPVGGPDPNTRIVPRYIAEPEVTE